MLIEHQSDTDPLMPLRLLYFAVVYWERQWHAWETSGRPRAPLRLRPVLPIVLYPGRTPWGSNRALADLLGEPSAFHAFAPAWRPVFWNLADQTPEALLNSGMEWLQTLAVVRVEAAEEAEFRAVYEEAVRRLHDLRGRDKVRWYDLMRIVLTWAAWRRPRTEQPGLWTAAEAIQTESETTQEMRTMAWSAAETWIEEGMEKGRVEGQLLNARTLLRELLEDRFAPLPEELIERINASTDLERLQAAFRQALRLKNIADLQL